MTNKKNLAVMIVIALTFGFMVTGCPDTSDDDPAPAKPVNVFNGTWVCDSNEDGEKETLILNENAFEIYLNDDEKQVKGTFKFHFDAPTQTINGIILTITHYYGDMLNAIFEEARQEAILDFEATISELEEDLLEEDIEEEQKTAIESQIEEIQEIIYAINESFEKISFLSTWYDKAGILNVLSVALSDILDEEITVESLFGDMLDEMFASQTGTATPGVDSVTGNLTLTITIDGEEPTIYTKQP